MAIINNEEIELKEKRVELFATRLRDDQEFRKKYIKNIVNDMKKDGKLEEVLTSQCILDVIKIANTVIKDEKKLNVIKKFALAGITKDDIDVLFANMNKVDNKNDYSLFIANCLKSSEQTKTTKAKDEEKKLIEKNEIIFRIGYLDTSL